MIQLHNMMIYFSPKFTLQPLLPLKPKHHPLLSIAPSFIPLSYCISYCYLIQLIGVQFSCNLFPIYSMYHTMGQLYHYPFILLYPSSYRYILFIIHIKYYIYNHAIISTVGGSSGNKLGEDIRESITITLTFPMVINNTSNHITLPWVEI
ncbi:hypothetical protein BDB01DRAFT_438622 [Pilobolus umbonatus]|nr:hypothetical protein BDB01DRAFT_438622 [Pilobolus umbonatus]